MKLRLAGFARSPAPIITAGLIALTAPAVAHASVTSALEKKANVRCMRLNMARDYVRVGCYDMTAPSCRGTKNGRLYCRLTAWATREGPRFTVAMTFRQ